MKKQISLCFDLSGEHAALREGLAQLLPELSAVQSENGICITAQKTNEQKLSVVREGNRATITYHARVHFFRALGLLVQHSDNAAYRTEETVYFDTNGVMLDVSQSNTLPTVAHLKKLLRRMALMGLNLIMLYNEDNYEIKGRPYFGYMRSRYTQEELREIDDYAFMLGIEQVPCIQTLAHLTDALKWPAFSGMRESKACLLPGDERVYEFLEDAIRAATAPVRSKRIHIGMDEAMSLGMGNYFKQHGLVNAGEIMISHLSRVMEILRRYDLKPMLWGDMFLQRIFGKYSCYQQDYGKTTANTVPCTLANGEQQEADLDFLAKYPSDAQIIAYEYSPAPFERWDTLLCQGKFLGRDPVFAGGIWNWTSFVPNWFFSFHSAIPALRACKKNGIREVFATTWGDEQTECPLDATLLGMQLWAELGYSEDYDEQKLKERYEFITGASFEATMLLEKIDAIPGTAENNPGNFNASKCLLWQEPFFGIHDKDLEGLEDEIEAHYRTLSARFASEAQHPSDLQQIFALYTRLCDVLELKATVGCRLKAAYDSGDKQALATYAETLLPELIARQRALYECHRDLFYAQNKPLGFEIFDIRHAAVMQRTQTVLWRLQRYLAGDVDALQELSDVRLYMHGAPSLSINLNYTSMISGSRLSYSASGIVSNKVGKPPIPEIPKFT